MDIERIEKLRDRRLKLQDELLLMELRKSVASQLTHLERFDESFIVYYENENLNWINSHVRVRNRDGYTGIHGDFQIDVHDSETDDCVLLKEEDLISNKFADQFSSLIHDENSLIVCHQGGDPELEISVKAFLSNPPEFLSRPETWIITTDKCWIIEYLWDQHVIRFIRLHKSIPTLIKKINLG